MAIPHKSPSTEYRFGAEVFSLDTLSRPAPAAKWIGMCRNTPALMARFEELFIVAQLTMLAHGQCPVLH